MARLEMATVDGGRYSKEIPDSVGEEAVMERFWLKPTIDADNGWTVVTRHVVAFRLGEAPPD